MNFLKNKIKHLTQSYQPRVFSGGITLVETIIYAVILFAVLLVIVSTIISITGSHQRALVNRLVESSASSAMEKMVREIKLAKSIDTGNSLIGTDPGKLALIGLNNDGTAYSLVFDVVDGVLRVTKDGGLPGNLTPSSVSVTSLIFIRVMGSNSEGVRIIFEVTGSYGHETRSIELTNFMVMRGLY